VYVTKFLCNEVVECASTLFTCPRGLEYIWPRLEEADELCFLGLGQVPRSVSTMYLAVAKQHVHFAYLRYEIGAERRISETPLLCAHYLSAYTQALSMREYLYDSPNKI
jgi:hypothetical protein